MANGFVNTPSIELANQFDWNYGYVSKLWEYEGWIDHLVGKSARKHYGAYSVRRKGGLRIITLNTDLCELWFCSYECQRGSLINWFFFRVCITSSSHALTPVRN